MAMATNKLVRSLGVLVRAALPVAILAAGWGAYRILAVEAEKAKAPPAEKQVVRTKVTELHVRDYQVVIKTHGVVQPHNQITLNPQVSGKIIHVSPAFHTGSYFSEGQLLVELDAKDYVIAVAMAKARHLGAESALQLATLNEERYLRLVRSNAVSKAEVEAASAARAQAAADLEFAAAQLERAELDLQRTKIWAPFDGRVRQKVVGLGQTVGPETALGDVFAIDFAEVRLPMSGRELQFIDLPELADDSPIEVELRDAISETSDTVWTAKIVRTEGVLDEDSRELFAIARVDDPFGRNSGHPPLRIGQPVVATIAGNVLTDVVALPRVSVRQLDHVNLVDKYTLALMPKTIVPIWSDEENIIVRDPEIQDGMLLSTTHLVYAPSGAKVEIIRDIEPASAVVKTDSTTKAEPIAN